MMMTGKIKRVIVSAPEMIVRPSAKRLTNTPKPSKP
jgi:hypothetical protein